MTNLAGVQATVVAGLTGLISGLALSIPVGPVNVTILNEAARRGFRWAFLIGMGATVMEVIYCFIAFTGIASFFTQTYVKAGMEIFSVGFMLYLGVKFLLTRSVPSAEPLGASSGGIGTRLEGCLHPHSAFMIGLVRVMANVGVLVFWVILAANFIYRGWVRPDWTGKLTCVAGVAAGNGLWFASFSLAASRGHGKLRDQTLLKMEHLSGVTLVILGLVHGVLVAREMILRR